MQQLWDKFILCYHLVNREEMQLIKNPQKNRPEKVSDKTFFFIKWQFFIFFVIFCIYLLLALDYAVFEFNRNKRLGY